MVTYCPILLQGGNVLSKYVALYAAELIKSNAALSALQLFSKYGAPPNPQVGCLCVCVLCVCVFCLCVCGEVGVFECGDVGV